MTMCLLDHFQLQRAKGYIWIREKPCPGVGGRTLVPTDPKRSFSAGITHPSFILTLLALRFATILAFVRHDTFSFKPAF